MLQPRCRSSRRPGTTASLSARSTHPSTISSLVSFSGHSCTPVIHLVAGGVGVSSRYHSACTLQPRSHSIWRPGTNAALSERLARPRLGVLFRSVSTAAPQSSISLLVLVDPCGTSWASPGCIHVPMQHSVTGLLTHGFEACFAQRA